MGEAITVRDRYWQNWEVPPPKKKIKCRERLHLIWWSRYRKRDSHCLRETINLKTRPCEIFVDFLSPLFFFFLLSPKYYWKLLIWVLLVPLTECFDINWSKRRKKQKYWPLIFMLKLKMKIFSNKRGDQCHLLPEVSSKDVLVVI